jgi:hypothetical protein
MKSRLDKSKTDDEKFAGHTKFAGRFFELDPYANKLQSILINNHVISRFASTRHCPKQAINKHENRT